MPITPLPEAPSHADTPEEFVVKADAFVAALTVLVEEINYEFSQIVSALNYNTVSTTSVAIAASGTKSFVVETGKLLQIGQYVTISSTVSPANAMFATIDDYDSVTGDLDVTVYNSKGSGTFADWTIALSPAGVPPGTDNVWTGLQTFSQNPVLTGGGVKFPATQVASADANVLDDYEEGTWTPDLFFGGAQVGMTKSVQTGRYTKIGRWVFFEFRITLTAKGSSTGAATITALPFTPIGSSSEQIGVLGFSSPTGTLNVPVFRWGNSSTTISLLNMTSGSPANLTDANFQNASSVVGSGWYVVA